MVDRVAAILVLRSDGAATLLEWDGNIPAFEICHAELLNARNYMNAEFVGTRVAATPIGAAEAISNPLDFLIPDVMASTALGVP